jgi:hypothetical protein
MKRKQWKLSEHWRTDLGTCDWPWDTRTYRKDRSRAMLYEEPLKARRSGRDGRQPKFNKGTRDRGWKKQLGLGTKETFYEALRQTLGLTRRHKVSSWVFHQDLKNECWGIVEEPATAQANEDTTSSLKARDVGTRSTQLARDLYI